MNCRQKAKCTDLTSKFWTNQEISFWQQFWFLEIWFLRFRVHFWTQRPLGRSALTPGLMFDIRLCGKPMGKPGKTQETFLTGKQQTPAPPFELVFHRPGENIWLNHLRPKFPVEFSLRGKRGTILHVKNLPSRDCHYYPEWALIQVEFSVTNISVSKILWPYFLHCDKDQIFCRHGPSSKATNARVNQCIE